MNEGVSLQSCIHEHYANCSSRICNCYPAEIKNFQELDVDYMYVSIYFYYIDSCCIVE